MNTTIEEIRKRIKAEENNIDAAGDYDEYADGRGVGLAAALRIIDEVEKEHPIPAEEVKILPKLREFLATATPEELEAKYRELEYLLAPKDENADIEREMQEIAERAPSDFCHYSDIVDREEWCKEKFRHFYAAGMLAEREWLASCPTIKGWIARDKNGKLYIYDAEPMRLTATWYASEFLQLDPTLFPSLRWEDEPKPVRVIIEEIKE